MGESQRPGDAIPTLRTVPSDVAKLTGLVYASAPIQYVTAEFSEVQSWNMLSPSGRVWAESVAGEKILDPHTSQRQYVWWCRVERMNGLVGPGGSEYEAKYRMWVFGKGGLAVAQGTTERFVEADGATKWRTQRFALTVDGTAVRSSHLASAAPAAATSANAGGGNDGSHFIGIVPSAIAPWFGNLPSETQRFLTEPFVASRKYPQKADLDATTELSAMDYRETMRCYLFNARWVSVAAAMRSVPYVSGLNGPALWNDSPESSALATAPWTVSAWVAPVLRNSKTESSHGSIER